MDMTGEFRIQAPRQRVWDGLYDPKILKECIPGCETIEKISDTEFAAKVVAKVGPVRAAFSGKVTLSDLDPPKAYTISGEGSGGVAGFAKGAAKDRLDDDGGDATVLKYEVEAHVGGKLAQIGSRLIDATARSMAQDFFGRFSKIVAPGGGADSAHDAVAGDTIETPEALATSPQADEAAAMDAAVRQTRSLPPWIWIGGLILLVVVIVALATR